MRPHRQQPTRLCHPWDSPGKNTGVGCHFLLQYMKVKVKLLSRVRLRDPMDCTLPGSSIHEIFQARVLEWVAVAFSWSFAYLYKFKLLIFLKVGILTEIMLKLQINLERTSILVMLNPPVFDHSLFLHLFWFALISLILFHRFQYHHFMENRRGKNGNGKRLYFGGLQNHSRWWLQPGN